MTFLSNKEIDAILIANNENSTTRLNIRYFTGFKGSSGYCLITKKEIYLMSDFRYETQVKSEKFANVIFIKHTNNINQIINEIIQKENITNLLVDQAVYLEDYLKFEKEIQVPIKPLTADFISNMRKAKNEDEIAKTKKACLIADQTFTHITNFIKVGMSELEIEAELERYMKSLGAEKISFDSIVASGVRGALPHAKATNKIIEKNELITLDFGCYYEGYASDITRTFGIGEINPKFKEIYEVVLKAQIAGVAACKKGIKAADVDKICRDIITEAGYGQYFGHGTGHGTGLDVHEEPRIPYNSTDILEAGNIITIEPGIYIEGLGGVRIEDDVLITEDGHEVLTKSNKNLIIIGE